MSENKIKEILSPLNEEMQESIKAKSAKKVKLEVNKGDIVYIDAVVLESLCHISNSDGIILVAFNNHSQRGMRFKTSSVFGKKAMTEQDLVSILEKLIFGLKNNYGRRE
jgi:hypothetical protein